MESTFETISNKISRQQAIIEIVSIAALAVLYIVAEFARVPKRWIFLSIALALLSYGIVIWKRQRETWQDFGLRTNNLASSLIPITIWTLLAAAFIVLWATLTNKSLWKPELAILLPFYPLYGVAQQLVFQGVLHRRLMVVTRHRIWAAIMTVLAFALVHLGDWQLVGLTALAGSIWTSLFQRCPNVWALGLSHGILAALTYPLILGADPLQKL